MKKAKRDITILTIGDNADFDEYKKFNKEEGLFRRRGFEVAAG